MWKGWSGAGSVHRYCELDMAVLCPSKPSKWWIKQFFDGHDSSIHRRIPNMDRITRKKSEPPPVFSPNLSDGRSLHTLSPPVMENHFAFETLTALPAPNRQVPSTNLLQKRKFVDGTVEPNATDLPADTDTSATNATVTSIN
jgi:hypothetical protein